MLECHDVPNEEVEGTHAPSPVTISWPQLVDSTPPAKRVLSNSLERSGTLFFLKNIIDFVGRIWWASYCWDYPSGIASLTWRRQKCFSKSASSPLSIKMTCYTFLARYGNCDKIAVHRSPFPPDELSHYLPAIFWGTSHIILKWQWICRSKHTTFS